MTTVAKKDEYTPRPFTPVLTAMLYQIPQEWRVGEGKEIVDLLNRVLQEAKYAAPEAEIKFWHITAGILNKMVRENSNVLGTEWEKTVRGIFNAQLDYTQYQQEPSSG